MGAAPDGADRCRILVVDEIELNRISTEAVLRGAAYEVDSVPDGAAALAALEDRTYDLVLIDLDMTSAKGRATAKAIRAHDRAPSNLVGFFGRREDTLARLRSRQAGLSAHIPRPIAPRAFLKRIDGLCDRPGSTAWRQCWDRDDYDEWVARLGVARMHDVLVKLLDQFGALLKLIEDGDPDARDRALRMAHDVSSTAGMLGFAEVTRRCRALLEADDGQAEAKARLADALGCAVMRLDLHLSTDTPPAVAA